MALTLQGAVGFAGTVRGGLHYLNETSVVYPVGATLVVRDIHTQEQVCL